MLSNGAVAPSPPTVTAFIPTTAAKRKLASDAPISWAKMYGITSLPGNFFVAQRAIVTAGFIWQPEIWPMAYIKTTTVRPKAMPIASQSPKPPKAPIPILNRLGNADPLVIIKVMAAAPAPMKTRKNVPMSSATNRFFNEIIIYHWLITFVGFITPFTEHFW